jgi:hypothetical protein
MWFLYRIDAALRLIWVLQRGASERFERSLEHNRSSQAQAKYNRAKFLEIELPINHLLRIRNLL